MTGRMALTVAALLLAAVTVFAHGIGVEAKLKGKVVQVEAYFDDDTPAADAAVTVTEESGRVVAEGKTDAKGAWSFPIPPAGIYRVAVNAGDGHAAKISLRISAPDPQPPPAAADAIISDGPSRGEFTRFPWDKVGLGLGGIVGVSAGAWWWGRRRRNETPPPTSQQ